MRQRYFIIEPKYSDPDTFCHFIVGSDRVRVAIQIYANLEALAQVAWALTLPRLEHECPVPSFEIASERYGVFSCEISVLPHDGDDRTLKFGIFQEWLDDGAPYRAEIRFRLTSKEAEEISNELAAWCEKPEYAFIWKGD